MDMIFALTAFAAGLSAASPVETSVSRLGPQSDIQSIEAIALHGCRAVPFLVRQLEIVGTGPVHFSDGDHYPREMRVIWSIAALRYITGRDFYAARTWQVDRNSVRHQMLGLGAPRGQTKSFGIWMSRGIVYFAPQAQQREVILKWRRYSASGACMSARGNRDITFWLYGVR